MIRSTKRITKALIRLRGCAIWFAPVLFANHRRQVFSRRGPTIFKQVNFNYLKIVYRLKRQKYRGEFNNTRARPALIDWYLHVSLFVMCKAWHQYNERLKALVLLNSPLVPVIRWILFSTDPISCQFVKPVVEIQDLDC